MKNHLILGDWNVICDVCGQKYKASETKKRWDGLIVCPQDFENRNEQDFLRVRQEKISVPFARPEAEPDTFLLYCSIEGRTAIGGIGVAGCAVSGYVSPLYEPPVAPFCTVLGITGITGYGVAGCSLTGNF